MGKHKPIYDPSTDCGDYVVVTECAQLHTTGRKMQQKLYYKQTTRPGALKSMSMERLMQKWGGGEILKRAVRGMLPKNRLRDDRMHRLKCEWFSFFSVVDGSDMADGGIGFEGHAHPYKQNLFKDYAAAAAEIGQMPEVRATLEDAKAQQASPQP